MTEQHQSYPRNSDLPNYLNKPTIQYDIQEVPASDILISWVWPVSFWAVLFIQFIIAIFAIRDFYNNYSPATHFFMTCTFAFSLATIALIYKFILMRGK